MTNEIATAGAPSCMELPLTTERVILHPALLTAAQEQWIADKLQNGIDINGRMESVGLRGWAHTTAMRVVLDAVLDGHTDSVLIVVDGHLIGDGLDEDWLLQNCPLLLDHTVWYVTQGGLSIIDIVDALPKHANKQYSGRSTNQITTLTIHHTVTPDSTTIDAIARYHVENNDWPGIGYHYLIKADGRVFQTNYLETVSYHSAWNNDYSVGIAIQGDFRYRHPTPEQLASATALVAYLKKKLTIVDVLPHRKMPHSSTICPGTTWEEWFYEVAGEERPPDPTPDPTPGTGDAEIGLHATADDILHPDERATFQDLKPGVIKFLSNLNEQDVRYLANDHPGATWIVRAFLQFGGRAITPQQFFDDTYNDVARSIKAIGENRPIYVELHNEPNLDPEGLGAAWKDGAGFNQWLLEVLRLYRAAMPSMRFMYPGLSPGHGVPGFRQQHIEFVKQSLPAARACDAIGVHAYWNTLPGSIATIDAALAVVDQYIAIFPNMEIWLTEASNNKKEDPAAKAAQYIKFWRALLQRRTVKGVTYFVASARDPQFSEEVWVGKSTAKIVGDR